MFRVLGIGSVGGSLVAGSWLEILLFKGKARFSDIMYFLNFFKGLI